MDQMFFKEHPIADIGIRVGIHRLGLRIRRLGGGGSGLWHNSCFNYYLRHTRIFLRFLAGPTESSVITADLAGEQNREAGTHTFCLALGAVECIPNPGGDAIWFNKFGE